ncbi:MAG: hypothetical protein H7647_03855 [Candidatus Heimdallarchaeota archaeon]|nr:hypothetical protein [Candidatus Heimdallarchaeota archaeon]MCK4253562.1 hypothetical protein [Candidatus Heimdallarchaeota archaeon]
MDLKRTRTILKSNRELRRRINSLKQSIFLSGILVSIVLGIIIGYFNYYFFFFIISKILIGVFVTFGFVYLLIDDSSNLTSWNNYNERKSFLIEKGLLAMLQTVILFAITFFIFLISRLSGFTKVTEERFLSQFPDFIYPKDYSPEPIQIFLIILVIMLSILSNFSSFIWFVGRFIHFRGFSTKIRLLKVDVKRFFLGWTIMMMIWFVLFPAFLDRIFIDSVTGNPYERWSLFSSILASNPNYLLLFQIGILVVINCIFFFDGIRLLKSRTYYTNNS